MNKIVSLFLLLKCKHLAQNSSESYVKSSCPKKKKNVQKKLCKVVPDDLMMAIATESCERNGKKSYKPLPDVLTATRSSLRYTTLPWLGNHKKSANSCFFPKVTACSPKSESFLIVYVKDLLNIGCNLKVTF